MTACASPLPVLVPAAERPRFEIVLRPDAGTPNPERALARVLKRLGRDHGFTCLSARELPPLAGTSN